MSMDELNEEQISSLVERLEERVAALQSSIHEHLVQLQEISAPGQDATPPGDLADQADVEQKRDEQNNAMTRDTREMLEISSAFDRLSAGEANVCVDCGEPIGYPRLLVQPTAIRCVSCQSSSEQHESMATGLLREKVGDGRFGG